MLLTSKNACCEVIAVCA